MTLSSSLLPFILGIAGKLANPPLLHPDKEEPILSVLYLHRLPSGEWK